jgi:hypothetical protein
MTTQAATLRQWSGDVDAGTRALLLVEAEHPEVNVAVMEAHGCMS